MESALFSLQNLLSFLPHNLSEPRADFLELGYSLFFILSSLGNSEQGDQLFDVEASLLGSLLVNI